MTDLLQPASTEAQTGYPNRPPKDAATLILLDRSGTSPKVLMGKRHHGHVFVPGKFVFPGGSVDPTDRLMRPAAPLDPRAEAKLKLHVRRPTTAKAQALALAAIRETFEETGLFLGSRRDDAPRAPAGAWSAFAEEKIHPDLSRVHFIARAITPPRRARRYDTRFFTADASAIAHKIDGKVGPDSELVELVWVPLDGIKERIELLPITEMVLGVLATQLKDGFSHDLPVPFFRVRNGKRVREFL